VLMVVSKKRREIIPNETKWAPSRKSREKLAGKEYSIRSEEDQSELPDGFRHAGQEIIEEFEALIPDLNGYNVSKYMRSVRVQFPFDGSVAVSALKNPQKLNYELKKIAKKVPGGFRRSFNGSPAEVGDLIDGTFKHAIEESATMNNADRVTKYHDIFDVFVVGCCDGMLNGRPVEVKSVSVLNSEKVMLNLAKNWFQFAAYNWLYGQSPIIVMVCRDTLEIEVIELEEDMVEVAMKNWSQWIYQIKRPVSHATNSNQQDSALAK